MYCSRYSFFVIILLCVFIQLLNARQSQLSNTNKNHELLRKLGLQRIHGPSTHHRKRLAVESRHQTRSDNSHMFIIKLPPNPHYYTINKPNTFMPDAKKIPLGFKNNGKPDRIYHWNLPILKKIVQQKQKSRSNDGNNFNDIDLDHPESWNDVLDKSYNLHANKRLVMKPSYYVPKKANKSNFFKYFPGNGKPHSFYVIEKNKRSHYHRLKT